VDEEGKEKKIVTAIEPFLPLPSGLYKCDSKFHTEGLHEQMSDQQTYGFVIVDGSMTSFHTLHGNNRQTIFKIGVSLPPKHGRGGQSKNRFERIREEKRGWYISKVAALAVQHFINPTTSLPNVEGIVLGGSAHLKEQFLEKLDPRLSKIVVAVVDTQYGGESGFYEAVQLTQDQLSNISFVHEQKLLGNFFEVISQNGLYSLCVEDTMYALTSGLLETLILWKNFPHVRSEVISVMNPDTKKVLFVDPSLKQPEESVEWNVVNSGPLLDWILEHYKEFGAEVVFVSDQTSSGSQFVKGFGGIGGLLRFEVSLPSMTSEEVEEDFEFVW